MQDRLQAMQIFTRVAELASFTLAAADLGLSKTHVSNRVGQLETHLGTRLLQRTTRRVTLTQDGQLYYQRCLWMLDEMQELDNLFQDEGQGLAGKLRIDMPTGLAKNLVLPKLGQFLDSHPRLEMEISCSDRRVDLVAEGLDAVLRVGAQPDQGVIARHLADMPMVSCASPSYLDRYGRPQSLADLNGHQLVHYTQVLGDSQGAFEYLQDAEPRQLAMPARLTVNQTEAYSQACLAGLGIIQVPEHGVRQWLASGQLEQVLPQLAIAPMPLWLLYPHRRHLSKRLGAFSRWLEGLLAGA
ncbi:LysR family transcriptional regulator [Gallaecimonas xiamenensis]|uniref:LysR family transcriptional regulator n=1 Tax=Gallaecimonas xiamenensis 3-C-1 TaxID=745411 RepID=K2JL56_9GAMM|nr:LysR family transcriptional regulator [Gallaecimonas xiamenensis]EKE75147.1 LysR family transcriptional regulator [Gallaecimonas xiamenensis 3-C-1]